MKILVTGGAGFIGSHLVEKLLEETKVRKVVLVDFFEDGSRKNIAHLINNKKLKIVKKDINTIKKNDNNFKNINCVFHLAAIADIVPSIDNPKPYCETNFMGTINILEAMRFHGVKKIIYTASSSCYGIPKKYPTNELDSIDTRYPYAFSKYLGELAIAHWARVYKINFISLRLFNVFGTRSRTTGSYGAVMGVFLKQKLLNRSLTIVGNGQQKRDFIDVRDVVVALIKAMHLKNKKNHILNIGSSNPIKIIDLAKLLSSKFTNIPRRPGEPRITFANILKAKKILKWVPMISFKEGIKELINNISYWKEAPLWTKSSIKKETKNWFKFLA
jgi:UDP-glucose 4-epimerase